MPVNLTPPKFTENPLLFVGWRSAEIFIGSVAYVLEKCDNFHKWCYPNRNRMLTMMNGDQMSEQDYDKLVAARSKK